MKRLLLPLLAILFCATSASAAGHPHRPHRTGCHIWGVADAELAAPSALASPELQARAAHATAYYTDVLQLNYRQSVALRSATLRLLLEQEQAPDSPLTGAARYDTAALRMLRPGQYSAFRLLEDRGPSEAKTPLAAR